MGTSIIFMFLFDSFVVISGQNENLFSRKLIFFKVWGNPQFKSKNLWKAITSCELRQKAIPKEGIFFQIYFTFFRQVRAVCSSRHAPATKYACQLSSARPSWPRKRPMQRFAVFRMECPVSVAKRSPPSMTPIILHWHWRHCLRKTFPASNRLTTLRWGPPSTLARPSFRTTHREVHCWTPSRMLSLHQASTPCSCKPARGWPS